jgi:hypothetical protein
VPTGVIAFSSVCAKAACSVLDIKDHDEDQCSHHHDRHRDKPKHEENRFLRKDHVVIEISEEGPDAKLSRRQPLDKATAEIPDEEKGQSQTYVRGKRISAATVIAPFVTLGLMAFLQVTKNAWCSGKS